MIYLLPHTVWRSAESHPEKTAFVCGRDRLKYAELATRMQQLAEVLRTQGVQRGDRVGVYLNRSIETAVAIYGILQAGAVYVPLNPKAPVARTAFQIEDCGIEVLVTNPAQKRSLSKLLVGARKQVQCLVGMSSELVPESISWEEVHRSSATRWTPPQQVETDLAYIIYTSGSTGKPKGIMHSHASGLAFVRNAVDRYDLSAEDIFGNHAPIYFDISQLAYFGAPLVGGTAIIASDAETIFPASLGQLIARERVTVWYSVPLAISQLLEGALPGELDLSALRQVCYAGEPLAPAYVRQLMTRCPAVTVSNWYGPAETNVCTCYDIPGPPAGDEPIPLGEVWQNTEKLLLDEADREVAPGEAGELLIRSTTSMLGYWNNPERNAQVWFVPDSTLPSKRYYRTGDRARIGPDGLLHFLGRADHQVKVRGYRVELGAVETVLLSSHAVREAVAFTLPEADGTQAIFAAVIPREATFTPGELRALLTEQLPWYALPKEVFVRKAFPRTGSDKVDRPGLIAELSPSEPS